MPGEIDDESLSPAERIGRAFADWRLDYTRRDRRPRFGPVEVALFSVIAAVALLLTAGVFSALADSSEQGFTVIEGVIGATGQWATPVMAIALLAAAFLDSYQRRRSRAEVDSYLAQDRTDSAASEGAEVTGDIGGPIAPPPSYGRRSRAARACLGLLGLLSASAAMTLMVWVLQKAVGSSPALSGYTYVGVVGETLAVVLPAVACVVVAARG
jgi:hypothetical protein